MSAPPGITRHFPPLAAVFAAMLPLAGMAGNPQLPLLNDPIDVSGDFRDFSDTYYLADKLGELRSGGACGKNYLPARAIFHPPGV